MMPPESTPRRLSVRIQLCMANSCAGLPGGSRAPARCHIIIAHANHLQMGARLEYILIPLAGGFGMAIVPMVGTNWGARQYRRAREIGWTGGATMATACAMVGLIVALYPRSWMALFSDDDEIIRLGSSYLRILGPIYGFYGLGMA